MKNRASSTYQLTKEGHEVHLRVAGFGKERWIFKSGKASEWIALRQRSEIITNVSDRQSEATMSRD